ncbi:MAG: sialidase family protein [Pirellulaceae bacterium]
MRNKFFRFRAVTLFLLLGMRLTVPAFGNEWAPGKRDITIPTIDISAESERQVVIAQGTSDRRQGHANTLLLSDGKSILMAWTYGHGGPCGPLKKSSDSGKTWSDLLEVPNNWAEHANCPPLYRLPDPQGQEHIFTFANRGPQGHIMYQAHSADGGQTWSPFTPSRLPEEGILGEGEKPAPTVMPFTAIVPVNDGQALLGVTNLRRPGEKGRTNVLSQSRSTDGGFSWSRWEIILDLGNPFNPCEPELIRSPDGSQLLMIIRENDRSFNSWMMTSDDEGKNWSKPVQATASVSMDRHQHQYSADGRLVMVGRDTAAKSSTRGHFIAWVGTYEDLIQGREGQYRVKLLPHHGGGNVEYPAIEVLPDGTFVATNSVRYRPGENYSVANTRFMLDELDRRLPMKGQ